MCLFFGALAEAKVYDSYQDVLKSGDKADIAAMQAALEEAGYSRGGVLLDDPPTVFAWFVAPSSSQQSSPRYLPYASGGTIRAGGYPSGGTFSWTCSELSWSANSGTSPDVTFSSTEMGTYTVHVTYTVTGQGSAGCDSGDIIIFACNLTIEDIEDDDPQDPAGLPDEELDPGGVLRLDGARRQITLTMLPASAFPTSEPADEHCWSVSLSADPEDHVEFWDAAEDGDEVTDLSWEGAYGPWHADTIPSALYVQRVESGETTLTFTCLIDDHYGVSTGSYSDNVSFIEVETDLDIGNGGSDLDNGEQTGAVQTTLLDEEDEEDPGAYLLVNWDNDNGSDPPAPDLGKESVTHEDNLARLTLGYTPDNVKEGTLTLSVVSGGSLVKFWTQSSKGTEVTDLSWDLAEDTPPSQLWVEGVDKSGEQRDVVLKLKYREPGAQSDMSSDTVKATVVMVNLGDAVYRETALIGLGPVGHCALVVGFTGQCTAEGLSDDANYVIVEMDGPTGNKTLDTITQAEELTPFGCYTNPSVTLRLRLRILKTALWLVDHAGDIGYCFEDAVEPDAWDDTLDGIDSLRCDGLVEVCYEFNTVMVWGAIDGGPPGYDILVDSYEAQHNVFDLPHWGETLMPATQCGYEHERRGTDWQTYFWPQDLCAPVGSTGGN